VNTVREFSGFDWDAGNREKCREHGLSIAEVEYVVSRQETLIIPSGKSSAAEARFLAIGRTQAGRYAFVVFTPRIKDDDVWVRPISARYMHRKEIKKYAQEISTPEE
jgi:uncharacterized DUF497 family protein